MNIVFNITIHDPVIPVLRILSDDLVEIIFRY